MTDKIRYNFINTTFIATGLILLFVLFIRVTRGLDLTDEMQYYGEIKGLIESGRLFSNDLFIQQTVYILFYPVLHLYHLAYGFEGLVFFSRLLMAFLTIVVFLFSYRKFVEFRFPSIVASFTALSLTFAIPYHGIFVPSYNTISQIIWIIFTLKFFEWKQRSAILWGILPIIMAFAHPTSAVTMSLLILARLLVERDFRQIFKLILVFILGGIIAVPVILNFAAPQEYLNALTFSSGYGVGTSFFSSKTQIMTLFVIYTMFGAGLLFWRQFNKVGFELLTSLFIVVALVSFYFGLTKGGYNIRVVCILSLLSAFAYAWSLSISSDVDKNIRQHINWMVVVFLAYATTLGVTSSNGIGQATGAFMVGLPLLLGISVSTKPIEGISEPFSLLKIACVFLIVALFVVHWSCYPYREDVWWQANQPIKSVPEFRFISTTPERDVFIQRMQQDLGPVTKGKRTLIVSEYPGLYLVLGAQPETCMLYMHSLTSDKSEKALLNCMSKKKPEIVIDIFADNDISKENLRIKNVMQDYYHQREFDCTDEKIVKFNVIGNLNPRLLKYNVCM